MNKLPLVIHSYISDYLNYKHLLLVFAHINKYFNSRVPIKPPKQPHSYTIEYINNNTIHLTSSFDGKFNWKYGITVNGKKLIHKSIRNDRFSIPGFFSINAGVWDKKMGNF